MVILLVALIGAGIAVWLLHGPFTVEIRQDNATAGEAPPPPEGPALVALEPFLVNLADPMGKRYLRITFDIEMSSALAAEEMKRKASQVRDTVLLVLTSKSFDDIRSATGKGQLREEILSEINKILDHGKARKVFFKEFVVQ